MNRLSAVVAAITTAIALLVASAILLTAQSQMHSQTVPMQTPGRTLDQIAHDATPDNPDSIKALAHSVVTFPHAYRFPPELSSLLEDSLTNAEIRYRNHVGAGVREGQIVSLMNDLAEKFQLPAYLETTPAQVRGLRRVLAMNTPSLMGGNKADPVDNLTLLSDGVLEARNIDPLDTYPPLGICFSLCQVVPQRSNGPLANGPRAKGSGASGPGANGRRSSGRRSSGPRANRTGSNGT